MPECRQIVKRIAATLTLGAATLLVVVAASAPHRFSFERLNRSYPDAVGSFAPTVSAPLSVSLSSPRNDVVVHRNRIRLTPRPDGAYDAVVDVEFAGDGILVADVTMAGFGTRLEDRVVAPRQRVEFPARLGVERVIGGLEVSPIALPARLGVEIRSDLGGRLVAWCELSILIAGAVDCAALEKAMSSVSVPLPEPGDTYVLSREEITDEEWADLVLFLDAHREDG